MSAYPASLLHNFINQGYINYHDHINDKSVTVTADNKMFVFGVNDTEKLCPDLRKAIQYHCCLQDNNNNTQNMEILVEQRLRWCGIDFEKEIPAIIVRNGEGRISNCMRLLSVCFVVMRGDARTTMKIKDIEIGIALNYQEKGLAPPPPPHLTDDIPF